MIAKIYDPLGWVTPVTITAKIFMQRLWRSELEWDDVISDTLFSSWNEIYLRLKSVETLKIPRWTGIRCQLRRTTWIRRRVYLRVCRGNLSQSSYSVKARQDYVTSGEGQGRACETAQYPPRVICRVASRACHGFCPQNSQLFWPSVSLLD